MSQCFQFFDFLSLPELVLNNLLANYLDLRSLKSLRLTCSQLKFIIENNPEILKRFRLATHRMNHLSKILRSKTPWNNLSVELGNIKNSAKSLFAKELEKISRKLAKNLKIVEFIDNTKYLEPFLLNSFQTLEVVSVLKLSELNLESIKLIDSFPILKVLRIEISTGMGNKLRNILDKCPYLRELTILQYEIKNEKITEDLTQVLKEYLKNRQSMKSNLPLKIKFDQNPLKTNPNDLIELAALCYETNAKLDNISVTSLPTYCEINNEDLIKNYLNTTIISVLSHSKKFEDKYIPPNCRTSAKFDLLHGQSNDNYVPDHLQSISVFTTSTRSTHLPDAEEILLRKIFISRPNLKELSLRDCPLAKNIIQFNQNHFPNLTKLELYSWGNCKEDFWILFESLQLLESLILDQCSKVCDVLIIGPETEDCHKQNRSMLALKNLKHLTLTGYWSITDISFRKVFSKMRLQTFQVWDDPGNDVKVVTLAGVESLRRGIFGETIEFLKMNRPYNSTHLDMKNILKKCKQLK